MIDCRLTCMYRLDQIQSRGSCQVRLGVWQVRLGPLTSTLRTLSSMKYDPRSRVTTCLTKSFNWYFLSKIDVVVYLFISSIFPFNLVFCFTILTERHTEKKHVWEIFVRNRQKDVRLAQEKWHRHQKINTGWDSGIGFQGTVRVRGWGEGE